MSITASSIYQKAWQRFCRNRPALGALWFVGAAVGIALFGYALAPDHSPNANTQFAELALQKPGSRVDLLPVALNRPVSAASRFSRLWRGTEQPYRLIPVQAHGLRVTKDSIYFQRVGSNAWEGIPLVQRFFAVQDTVRREGEWQVFRGLEGAVQRVSDAELSQKMAHTPLLQTRTFWLGTDKYGRCILSRLLLGFRVSLLVGGIAVAISLTIGLLLGVLGGYFGGRVDDAVLLLVNTIWSIPTLLLVFAIVLALGRGIGIVFLAVGLTMWVEVARVVRGQVLALRDLPFVEAARSLGLRPARILWRHILPNLLGPVLVVAAANFSTAILLESGLSYLGFGVQPPTPSWGVMLNEHYGYALGGHPLLALAPALVIASTVLAFNLIGNGLRDALDVKSSL